MRPLPSILFAVVALLVLFGMHRYFWARAVRDLALPRRAARIATVAVVLLGVAIVPCSLLARTRSTENGGLWSLPIWLWLGFLFYAVVFLALAHFAGWLAFGKRDRRVAVPGPVFDPDRRLLFKRVAAGASLTGAGAVAWLGERNAAGEFLVPEIPVKLDKLPRALAGLRIAQLSDVHIGPLLGQRFLTRLVGETLRTKPDLIVITGDLVDGSVANLKSSVEPLFALHARYGVYFVTGNHEYYSGATDWIEYLKSRGIRVLQNERVSIGDAGASFDLVGIPDLSAGNWGQGVAPDLEFALAGRDPERESILLAHQPAQIHDSRGIDLGLQLSGHTHGGQMWPFGALVLLAQPYLSGLHRHSDRTQIYVSRGAGTWGPPLRVANPSEIDNIILI